MMQRIVSHPSQGLIKLVPPFWGKPRIASLLVGFLEEVQALEDAIWSLLNGIDVDTCERYALEGLAKIIGETRRPASDDTLRTYVKGRIAANRSDGTPAALATVITALAGSGAQVLEPPYTIEVLSSGASDPQAAAEILDDAVAGGIATMWTVPGTFAWPDESDPSPPSTGIRGTGTLGASYR